MTARGAPLLGVLLLAACAAVEPVDDPAATAWTAVTVGGAHACALTTEGRVACWGANDRGQAGTGGGAWDDAPAFVQSRTRFASVVAGARHTCALDLEGRPWCWGANDQGQLGDGTLTDRSYPFLVQVQGRFAAVGAGAGHTCATRADGLAFCWGASDGAQTGLGVRSVAPSPPTPLAGGLRFAEVSAGGRHGCGITVGGEAYCWGEGRNGALGTAILADSPSPSRVSGGVLFRTLRAGANHTCAVDMDGRAWCWGRNDLGQVAPGAEDLMGTPALRDSGPFLDLGVGEGWTCGLRVGGAVICWGVRWDRPVGAAYAVARDGWVADGSATRLAVGSRSACTLHEQGGIRCWGGGVGSVGVAP